MKWRRPEGGPKIAVYDPSDVERLRQERNPEAPAFVHPAKRPIRGKLLNDIQIQALHETIELAQQRIAEELEAEESALKSRFFSLPC